jgi:predicted NUDIX family NTP pyrophosphohydrolase
VRARAKGIDVLVVSSADPVWSDRNGWVWSTPVLFASPHVRLIATRDLAPEQ